MMTRLLGLELSLALAMLERQGITPTVVQTRSPRRKGEEGTLRVVHASDDARQLTVCRFLDPLDDSLAGRPDSVS